MRDEVFLDTSFIYALSDMADPVHPVVSSTHEALERPPVLTSYVLAEAMSLLTKRATKHRAVVVGDRIVTSSQARVIRPTDEDFDDAWALFAKYPDWDFDLVDAISFALMKREEIETALTFDSHFSQMGFETMPGMTNNRADA
ncbi:MAG: PIN domain-containing protein [Armatimonadota bacterium]